MGTQWRHSFDRSLKVIQKSGVATATANRPDGRSEVFNKSGSAWTADVDNPDILVEIDDVNGNPTGYRLNVATLHHIETYDVSGLLQSVADENGQGIILTYSTPLTDPAVAPKPGLLLNVTASDGRALNFTYDSTAHLHQMTQPDGGTFVYGYDSTGNLTTVQYPDTKVRQYLYNEQDLTSGNNLPSAMTGIIDESGVRFESTSFDSLGRATFTSLAGGAGQTTISYNASSSGITFALGGGATQTFLNPNGHIRTANYDATCKPACGTQWQSRTYDANGYPSSYTDFNGNLTQVAYSASGLLTELIEASGSAVQRTTDTTWDTTLRQPTLRTLKDAAGTLVTKDAWVYNTRGQPLATCSIDPVKAGSYVCAATGLPPDGVRRTTYTYCDAISTTCPLIGLVLTIDGPRTDVTDVTTYSYYTSSSTTSCGTPGAACHQTGDLYQVNNALGQTTTYASYDANGRITRITDPNGINTDFTYTERGWLLTRTYGGATTTYGYDAMGDVNKITDPDNVITTYTYDGAHRLTDVTDALGSHIHYSLDAAGNRTMEETYNPSGQFVRSTSRTFDTLGHLTQVKDSLGNPVLTASYPDSYDANGSQVHTQDAYGVQRLQGFDALNRLHQTLDDYQGSVPATANMAAGYGYDAENQVTSVTDSDALSTSYGFDGLGNRVSLRSPDTGTTTTSTDAAGNRLTVQDAKGVVAQSSFDALNRLTGTNYPTASLNVAYYYDEANSVTGCASSSPIGHLTRIVESAVSTTFCYDARGNIIKKAQTTGASTDVLTIAYSLAGREMAITYPSGTAVHYTRNTNGKVSGVTVTPIGGSAVTVASNVTYLPFGPVASYSIADNQALTRTYDKNYGFTDVVSPALDIHVQRDVGGRIFASSGGGAPAESYGYDNLGRIISVIDGSTQIQGFTYNKTGDRTTKSGTGIFTGTYQYVSATHQLSSIGNAARSVDANGNTTAIVSAGATLGFGYNDRNRLTIVQQGGQTVAQYVYNALNQRVAKQTLQAPTSTERFVYEPMGHLLTESGTVSRDYVWLGNVPVAMVDNTGTVPSVLFVHADGMNTPRAITNSAGAVVWSWAFSANAFGEQQPSGSVTFNLRFAGQYFDQEAGLVQNGRRTFEPATGRYLQSDPVGLAAGGSTFSYAQGNPLTATDATGLISGPPEEEAPEENIPVVNEEIARLERQEAEEANEAAARADHNTYVPPIPASQFGPLGECKATDYDAAGEISSPNIHPRDLAGLSPQALDAFARNAGLKPMGPDPMNGRGSYDDPVTGEQRVLSHPNDTRSGPHMHVNDPSGQRLDINGNPAAENSPGAHLPIGK